jgi:ABC-type uncharacterized transport system permease subunit
VTPEKTYRTGVQALLHYLGMLALWILLSMVVGSIMLLAVKENPLRAYTVLFQEAFLKPRGIAIAVQRATPLILTSGAAVVAFQAGAINMGLAGQFAVGASVAAMAGYALPPLPKIILIPLILLLSGCGGAMAGFVPAIFKRLSGISEIITGMISNYVAPLVFGMIVRAIPLLSQASRGASRQGVQPAAYLSQFVELTHGGWGSGTKANTGLFVAIGVVLFLAWWMRRSKMGFEMRMTRVNFNMAEFAGIKAGRAFFIGLMLSGAIAAMAGAVEILGIWRGSRGGTLNIGEKDLIIALIGGQSYIGSMFAAMVYGGLESGTMNVSWSTNIARPFIDMLVQLIVIFAAAPSMMSFFSGESETDRLGGRFLLRDD